MITAIVTSDNHLGAYYSRLLPERLEKRRRALQRGFKQVVDAAVAERADLFLQAGDLFDRPDPRNAERLFVAQQVRRLLDASIPVFAIAGNHDRPRSLGYDGGTLPHAEMEALGAIHLFHDTAELQPHDVKVNGYRVCIWGASADFNRPLDTCPLQEATQLHERGGDLDLALLHYGVEGWAQPFAQEPCLRRENLDRLRADAICVGHLHARNRDTLPGGALLLNPGATEHVHFGEEHLDCGYWKLRMEPGRVEAEYVRLTPQGMRTEEIDLTPGPEASAAEGEDGDDPLMEWLLGQVAEVAQADQLLRLRLRGRISPPRFRALDLPRLQEAVNRANFHCQIETDDLMVVDELLEQHISWGGSFDVETVLEEVAGGMTAAAKDPAEQEICRIAGQQLAVAYARITGRAR